MPGYYTALSGMQSRLADLDRLATDIANASTTGYKTERVGKMQSDRGFGAMLQSTIDVSNGATKLDIRAGAVTATGRALDVAVEGDGFLVVETPAGVRYTRNGHLSRRADGMLTTSDGDPLLSEGSPIMTGPGPLRIDPDGTVREKNVTVGKLDVVAFESGAGLSREGLSRIRNDGPEPTAVEEITLVPGALEQSNVSVVERIAELTNVTRGFDDLQKATTVMNDNEVKAITEIGRR